MQVDYNHQKALFDVYIEYKFEKGRKKLQAIMVLRGDEEKLIKEIKEIKETSVIAYATTDIFYKLGVFGCIIFD